MEISTKGFHFSGAGVSETFAEDASSYAENSPRLRQSLRSPDSHYSSAAEDHPLLQRFYESVDAPCQVACQGSIEDQLDLLTHCRQPMEFLSFFREDASSESVGVEVMPAGAYVLPTFCEYCHAANVAQCPAGPTCRRPRLYFQKKRPPFCPPDATLWDATTDHAHPPPQVESPATVGQASWLSMFSSSEGD